MFRHSYNNNVTLMFLWAIRETTVRLYIVVVVTQHLHPCTPNTVPRSPSLLSLSSCGVTTANMATRHHQTHSRHRHHAFFTRSLPPARPVSPAAAPAVAWRAGLIGGPSAVVSSSEWSGPALGPSPSASSAPPWGAGSKCPGSGWVAPAPVLPAAGAWARTAA